jgi:calcineurin-like phosphoesterase family protein
MTTFFCSDTHFGHRNIIKYSERPFADFEEMDWKIVDQWNKTVGPTDVVYHLGDVAMGDSSRWDDILSSLNGYKVLVVGNHDRIFAGEKPRQREKWDEKYHEWFDEVYDNFATTLMGGYDVNLSHFPYDGDSHDRDRYSEFRLKDEGKILVHGHTHAEYHKHGDASRVSRSAKGTLQIHVGMDAWHYKPVPESRVVELIEANS